MGKKFLLGLASVQLALNSVMVPHCNPFSLPDFDLFEQGGVALDAKLGLAGLEGYFMAVLFGEFEDELDKLVIASHGIFDARHYRSAAFQTLLASPTS